MAKLKIYAANQAQYDQMLALDHRITIAWAYKLEVRQDGDAASYNFQRVKLPREVSLSYPRDQKSLLSSWNAASLIYVGMIESVLVSYVVIEKNTLPNTARITDLVVTADVRQKGVGATMLAACEDWTAKQGINRILLEVPMRNDPVIQLANRAGYSMCGYLDQYFPNGDPALFYGKRVG